MLTRGGEALSPPKQAKVATQAKIGVGSDRETKYERAGQAGRQQVNDMITSRTEYLLLALLDLARHKGDEYVLSRDVAERQGIPAKYMPQLMAILTRKGWVDSARGAGGGVKLAVDPKNLTVQDVIDVSGDPLLVKACVSETYHCARKPTCSLFPLWERAQESMDAVMRGATLADLMNRS